MRKALNVIVPCTVSFIALLLIYRRADLAEIGNLMIRCDRVTMGLAMFMFPITWAVSAKRLCLLVNDGKHVQWGVRLILMGSVLNVLLPSKMGDLAKGVFVFRETKRTRSQSLFIVVVEKAGDLLSLMSWCVFGLMFSPGVVPGACSLAVLLVAGILLPVLLFSWRGAGEVAGVFLCTRVPVRFTGKLDVLMEEWGHFRAKLFSEASRLAWIIVLSIALWGLHLTQIWLFFRSLGGGLTYNHSLAVSGLSLMVGLVPISVAGIGTRDAALVYLTRTTVPLEIAASVGVLCVLRYVVPALAGLPFSMTYLRGRSRLGSSGDKSVGGSQ